MTEAVAVFDVGISNVKLLVISQTGKVIAKWQLQNYPLPAPPYLHVDVEKIWQWLLGALATAAKTATIRAIIPCAHGSAAALIDDNGLTLPVMHYEAQPPPSVAAAYAEVMPDFAEVLAPLNPGGLTLARQLLWQQQAHPQAFDNTRHIICYAQYWAWRLCGVAANEYTSLGAQTHLWAPLKRAYSALVDTQKWRTLLPPLHLANESLGPLLPAVQRDTGLPTDTAIICGIHDSNANFLRYIHSGRKDFILMSTGTWIINFNPAFNPEQLAPQFDTNTNSDVHGNAIACSRFMGGREYATLIGDAGISASARQVDIEWLVSNQTMALPSFSDSGGPFPNTGNRGRIVGPSPSDAKGRVALATLYTAAMAATAISHIDTGGAIIVDGTFANNTLFCRLLAALFADRQVWTAQQTDGTAQGAALLWSWPQSQPFNLTLNAVKPASIAGLSDYFERWQEAARN